MTQKLSNEQDISQYAHKQQNLDFIVKDLAYISMSERDSEIKNRLNFRNSTKNMESSEGEWTYSNVTNTNGASMSNLKNVLGETNNSKNCKNSKKFKRNNSTSIIEYSYYSNSLLKNNIIGRAQGKRNHNFY